MAVYQVPQQLKDIWDTSKQSLIDILASATMQPYPEDRLSMFTPAQALGNVASQAQQGIPQGLADLLMQGSPQQAMSEGISGLVGPMQIAENFRSPEMIRELRRIMAEENKARGPVIDNAIDDILRTTWYHGARPESRGKVYDKYIQGEGAFPTIPEYDEALYAINQIGLQPSNHAVGNQVRFGEPAGISLSAHPRVSHTFSGDDYIHRVFPIYGDKPSNVIIPAWRTEGGNIINQGYDQALDKWLNGELSQDMPDIMKRMAPIEKGTKRLDALNTVFKDILEHSHNQNERIALDSAMGRFENVKSEVGLFNTLLSNELENMGYRGILYPPTRYGEYELAMFNPQNVKPIDYRKYDEYIKDRYSISPYFPLTKKANRGYLSLRDEFAKGNARLSDIYKNKSIVSRLMDYLK